MSVTGSRNPKTGQALGTFNSFSSDEGINKTSLLCPSGRKTTNCLPAILIDHDGTDNLQYYSRHLEDSIVHGRVRTPHDPAVGLFFDWQVVAALQEWTTSNASQIINVVGPSQIDEVSPTAPIASHCIDLAVASRIPVISFFCELPRRGTSLPHAMAPEMAALISLTYALIRQLIELLPCATISCPTSLNRQSFERLNGCPESLDDALDILGELLQQSPPILLCIIDGLQKLDDQETRRHLTQLLETLRGQRIPRSADIANPDLVLKILFTTAGRSRCLLNGLSRNELVFAESSNSSRRTPGRSTPGRRSLSPNLLATVEKTQKSG